MIGGIDEVGRGALAGPVCASCVILPRGFFSPLIRDSKTLTHSQRLTALEVIKAAALDIGTGWIAHEKIDEVNIYQATLMAMKLAVTEMSCSPDYLLLDAMKLSDVSIPQEPVKKGDSKSISIAAASIVAKVARDAYMTELDSQYPQYGFSRNKGYGTQEHRNALKKYGPSPMHRRTFAGVII